MAQILVVDDERFIRETVSALLEAEGYEVTAAADAGCALERLRENPIDVMVVDIVLPSLNGVKLLHAARDMSPHTQVIFMTGTPAVDTAAMALREGAFDYVTKPIEKNSLLMTVQKAGKVKALLDERERLQEQNSMYQNRLEELVDERTRALQGSEERLKAILETALDAVITIDEKGIIDSFNKAAERIFGYSASEMIGQNVKRLMPSPHSAAHDEYLSTYAKAGVGRIMWKTREEVALRKDGVKIPIELSVSEFKLHSGRRFTGTVRDLSEKKRAELENEQGQNQLIHADKMASLGVLVSGVAHEINNPNHLVLLGIDQLRDVWTSVEPVLEAYFELEGDFDLGGMAYSEAKDEIPQTIATVRDGAKRIMNIVFELREYAREKPPALDEVVAINRIVSSATTLLSNMLKKSTDNFSMDLQQDLPEIMGNYQRLEQVLINLLQNACQALDGPHERIQIATSYDEESKQVIVEVTDEGEGIAPENLGHIIDPFFTTKRSSGGTGLGLSVSSGIILEHGGKLDFNTTLGKGTTARVSLPVPTGGDNTEALAR